MKLLLFFISFIWLIPNNFQQYHFGKQIILHDLGETKFYQVSDFKIDKGRIYIADTKALSVYVFNSSGQLINSSGRKGRGPGEFVHGPRLLVPTDRKVYVIGGMRPFLFEYDKELHFLENRVIKINPINVSEVKYFADKLFLITTQYFKEDLIIYNPADELLEKIDLNFKIEPGMLSNRSLIRMNKTWLFAWHFQNKFKIFNSKFSEINSFRIEGIQDKAEGRIVKTDFIPPEASVYRAKVYQAGAFYPAGTFFNSFVKLNEKYLLVQLGTLTGGTDKALIIDLDGNIKQRITLPQTQSRILDYSDETLYMINRNTGTISAYEFLN